MRAVDQINRLRLRAVAISRAWKTLLHPRAAYRWTFLVDGGDPLRTATHHVLSDLRDFCFARSSAFDPDPVIMARRQGRRDVWLRISNYLNLDEEQVQLLMEIDDGI